MSYILKNPQEAQRLNDQSKIKLFDPKEEINEIEFHSNHKVLDAGCGSGIFASELGRQFPGSTIEACDIDLDQLEFARSKGSKDVSFFQHDLLKADLKEKYDHIVNRYFAHHFNEENYSKILSRFHSALNPSGQLSIIDVDGVLSNIGTTNETLLNYLKVFNSHFGGDLHIARKIPTLLEQIGFTDIKWKIKVMDFKEEDKYQELNQWEQRIEFGFQVYIQAFGTEFEARKFKQLFLEEIRKDTVPVFYNKFIINCKKPD